MCVYLMCMWMAINSVDVYGCVFAYLACLHRNSYDIWDTQMRSQQLGKVWQPQADSHVALLHVTCYPGMQEACRGKYSR